MLKANIIAAIALALFIPATASFASDDEPLYSDKTMIICETVANVSETIMEFRQRGDSLSDALAMSQSTNLQDSARFYVINAYKIPQYTTKEMQSKAIRDFRNKMHLECIEYVSHIFKTDAKAKKE